MSNRSQLSHNSNKKKVSYFCTNCGHKIYQKESKVIGALRSVFIIGVPFFISIPMQMILGSSCHKCNNFAMVRPDTYLGKYVMKRERKKREDVLKFKKYKRRREVYRMIFVSTLFLIGVFLILLITVQTFTS